jgi:hypothetical protein
MDMSDKAEERSFQLELAKLQHGIDISSSIISVIASVFVAIIATTLTLIATLPKTVFDISIYIVGLELGVAIFTLLVSWWIILQFRDRRMRAIKRQYHIPDDC